LRARDRAQHPDTDEARHLTAASSRRVTCGVFSAALVRVQYVAALEVYMSRQSWLLRSSRISFVLMILLTLPVVAFAQSPWERAALNLEATFTGPLARSLALVAIVIGGLMFMFGEGGAKRQISGIVFGGGLALFAVQFLTWLF
jgi:type IV secretory pathway VirB2 component (pilin)